MAGYVSQFGIRCCCTSTTAPAIATAVASKSRITSRFMTLSVEYDQEKESYGSKRAAGRSDTWQPAGFMRVLELSTTRPPGDLSAQHPTSLRPYHSPRLSYVNCALSLAQ